MVVSRVVVREALDAADSVADVVEKIAMALVETGDVSVLLTGAVSPVVVRGALDDAADSVVTADDTVKIPVETTEGIAVLELLSGAELWIVVGAVEITVSAVEIIDGTDKEAEELAKLVESAVAEEEASSVVADVVSRTMDEVVRVVTSTLDEADAEVPGTEKE
ncbi:hypothetical protein MMC10_004746 [Thelotrema lepadinum]|nr:hypothetical protein [Thelotrema lepadinum]